MSGKVNRGLLLASVVLSVAITPTAQAVSDDVALQLLERLGELEKEVSNLRGQNETLRNELQGVKALQRGGGSDIEERASGLEGSNAVTPTATMTAAEPAEIDNPIELPALEDPVLQRELQPAVVNPPVVSVGVPVNTGAPVPNPEDRRAVAPAVEFNTGGSGASAKIDSNSPESYYYYGTEDKNQDKSANTSTTPSAVDENKAVSMTPDAVNIAAIPDAHKAKAEYNQAYKALVNDPVTAIPAFRTFLRKYPNHELAANAQYWLGEALYAQKDFSGATAEFMVVLKNHKSSPKAPGAALKLGYSFYELKQWDFARRTLEDTIRFYPDSNAAGLAKHRLEKMKAEGH